MSNSDDDDNFSEVSADDTHVQFVLPTTNPTMNDFRRALSTSQEREAMLLRHNEKLRSQVGLLKTRLKHAKRLSGTGGQRRRKKALDPLLNHDKIVLWGKKYAVVISPWVHASMFMSSPAPDALKPDSVERFSSFESYECGATSELLAYLSNEPEMQEQAQSYTPFRDAFTTQVNNSRSTALHNVRASASIIFSNLGLPGDHWDLSSGSKRKESPLFQKLLIFGGENRPKPLIPLYYPDLKKNDRFLFMVEYLPTLLRLVFFGRESLTATTFKFSERLVGRQWGVKSVTASMIAFAAIAAKYIVSNDSNFVEIGQVSKIPYHQEFYKIRAFLKSVENSDYYKQLISFWNHRVFKGLHVSAAKTSDVGEEDSDVDDMTAAMMAVMLSTEPAASGSADQANVAGTAGSTQAAPSSPVIMAATTVNILEIEQEEVPALPTDLMARTSNAEAQPQHGGRKAPSGRGRKKVVRTPAEPRPTRRTVVQKDK